jgi:uncharacterized cofD-like protein
MRGVKDYIHQPFARGDLKIAVIGGGTGSFTLLSGLKEYTSSLTALVNMADDGGSTGLLRDELGVLPPGDVRQCLVALANAPKVRDLFNYRFEEGSLKGHAFGNLFLTALEKMTGNFADGVELASEVLNITGVVEPVTLTNVKLAMRTPSCGEVHGEFAISKCDLKGERPEIWLEPEAAPNPQAVAAIHKADIVVIAPGSLYNSLAPALVVPGIGEALAKSQALKVYVCNLVTKPGQTDGYSVSDFAHEIERFAGRPFLDVVLFNTRQPDAQLLKKYATYGELAVEYDEAVLSAEPYRALGGNLLAGSIWESTSGADPIAATRTLIRHDPVMVARSIVELYDSRGSIGL